MKKGIKRFGIVVAVVLAVLIVHQLLNGWSIVHHIIKLVDTQAPVITLVTKEDYYTKYDEEYQEEGFSAIDDFDGDITDKVVVTKDKEKVYYKVSDRAGNETKVEREIPYDDRTSPVITLNGDSKVELYVDEEYIERDAVAVDDIDGDISHRIVIEGDVDTQKAGSYQVVYQVKDNHENEASVVRDVLVKEKTNAQREEELGKVIYLTFDDGPGPYTNELLDLLDRYQVKATFFVCNTAYVDLIKEEYDRGHSVAIHAYAHDYEKLYKSLDAYYEDLNKMSDIIYKQTGERTKLLRFPGGSSIRKEIMPTLTKDVVDKGYQYFDWNVSSGDGAAEGTAEGVLARVTEGCALHDVNVVLQHDSKKWSLDAVEDIIKWGLENGYTFLPLDETSYPAHHI